MPSLCLLIQEKTEPCHFCVAIFAERAYFMINTLTHLLTIVKKVVRRSDNFPIN